MKFTRAFETENEYVSYRDGIEYVGEKYTRPNVSLTRRTKTVHYNYPLQDPNNHSFIDLGLSSGTLWAPMNVGASKPEEAGLYFAWGDTVGYSADQVGMESGKHKFAYDWSDYKFGSEGNFSKYKEAGATLELQDDAANANMKGEWHMPSQEQIQELINNTTTAWTASNGVSGMTFTSSNGKSIFIPAANFAYNGSIRKLLPGGFIWSSVLFESDSSKAKYFHVAEGGVDFTTPNYRCIGIPVRGVLG